MREILAPAGDEKSAYAAIDAGADAIYLGLTAFSARSSATNFDTDALKKLLSYAHALGVKIYVAMNTLVKDSELAEFVKTAIDTHNAGADAIIIQDIYLGAYLKKTYPRMCLHLSTQAGICNAYGARYAKELGFSRVILARETKLADVKEIAKIIETEVFVQGALCTCFSGQCYLSSFAGGNSGNRGKCKQPCRKKYGIDRKGFEDYAYRISLSDLSVGERIEDLIDAGVSSFKIEGRMRRPEYVAAAVKYYKKLLSGDAEESDFSALKRTYNRGNYTKGLTFGQDKSFISSAVQGHIGEYLGTIAVENGKYLCRTLTRCVSGDAFKILRDGKEVCGAVYSSPAKGGFYIKSSTRLRGGDKVFITTDARLNARLLKEKRSLKILISAEFSAGKKPCVYLNGKRFEADFTAETAQGRPLTAGDIIRSFDKVDTYPFEVEYGDISIGENTFVPASFLNAFRRSVYAQFYGRISDNGNQRIEEMKPLPSPQKPERNSAVAVIARNLNGVKADIGVLKPDRYGGDLSALFKDFAGQKFLYLPSFLTGEEIERIKPLTEPFDGIYCGGNYAVPLAKSLNKKLFAGAGFNLFNFLSLGLCPADYTVLSKELAAGEAKPLARANTFLLTSGDIKVMDLIYCPFGKSCKECDKRNFYTLTDENGRAFPLRRYEAGECRFELFNCAELVAENNFTGVLAELTTSENPALFNDKNFKSTFKNHTKGHFQSPVL